MLSVFPDRPSQTIDCLIDRGLPLLDKVPSMALVPKNCLAELHSVNRLYGQQAVADGNQNERSLPVPARLALGDHSLCKATLES